MKFSFVSLLIATATFGGRVVVAGGDHDDEPTCSHGKLYVMDDATAKVHVIDTSSGRLENLQVETTVSLPEEGAGALAVYGPPADPLIIQYRGEDPDRDGYVRVIDTGFRVDSGGHVDYVSPSIYSNALIDDCSFPVHQVRHDGKVAIFCDGSYNAVPQVNTTVHVVDTTKLGVAGQDAVTQSVTLEGVHHGVAVPVDDGHLLHSVALPERILRVEDASSLPATFLVIDNNGNVINEQLTDTSSADTSCAGFHGSASLPDETFFLACGADHGGIVVVVYDPATETYTSRAITYPDDPKYDGLRVGNFAYHKKSSTVVGSFALFGGTEYHLLGIQASTMQIQEENILTLPGTLRQCGYGFEVGFGKVLTVFMPDGVLHVFKVENGTFESVAQKQIVDGMTACSEAVFTVGINQAFVATPADNKLYGISLHNVIETGEMTVTESATLPFTPTVMTVSGFSLDKACTEILPEPADEDDADDQQDDQDDGEEESPATTAMFFGGSTSLVGSFLLAAAAAAAGPFLA